MSKSFIVIDPESKFTIPQILLINVDLPAPFGPKRAKISPFFICKLILSRAFSFLLYVLVTLFIFKTILNYIWYIFFKIKVPFF